MQRLDAIIENLLSRRPAGQPFAGAQQQRSEM
jgi:hypothetical protein